MIKILAIIFFLFLGITGFSQGDSLQARIVLIGDAGKLNFGRHPVVDAARNLVPLDEKTTIIYLGDNLYQTNLPPDYVPTYEQAKAVLDSQINIARGTDAKVIFIPGNHDWHDGGPNGLENVRRQQAYIDRLANENVKYLPENGCPGPVEYKISEDVLLVIYDSEWLTHEGEKPGIESDCEYKTEEQVFSELDDILGDNSDKLIILASHHTLKSYGIHGGYFTLKQHIFPFTDYNPNLWIPLPVIGTIYPIARGIFGTPEDLKHPAYANLINKMEEIIKGYPNVILVGGHEHNLQLIKDSSHYYIVSGAGAKHTRVSDNKKVLFAENSLGFSTLEFYKNKDVNINFFTVSKDTAQKAFSKKLFNYTELIKASADSTKIPETTPEAYFEDSVTVAINKEYIQISGFQKLISGKNYRKEWATPVHLKVFRVDTEMGGFTIKDIGGGRQTKSLKMEDKNGVEWTLRTVDKDPEGAVPEALKGTIAQSIVQDMTSASHPYGALVVPPLADAIEVITTNPQYYFVPDDPKLGIYRQIFANKVCLLEKREPTPDGTDTKSTSDVIIKKIEDNKNHVDQEEVLRARLLDMVIGDWDRHFDQWKFGINDTGKGKLYYPIPRDRDQAFFNSDGLLAKAVSLAALPYLQGFKKHYPNLKWFNWEERDFDRIFLNKLDEEKWQTIIETFQNNINDSTIELALKRLPPEIYAIDAGILSKKMKSRRDLLTEEGMDYYRFLSREVKVVGSNESEYFRISNVPDGLEVKVFNLNDNKDTSYVMYHRVFDFKDTKFLDLYGLNGGDIFQVDPGTSSKIKLRIIGGEGNDTFQINGNIRNKIYDYAPGKNYLQPGNRTENNMSASPNVNRYDVTSFTYNTYRVPMLNIGYNAEDKLLVGVGYSLTTHGFRKKPFSTFQKLTSLFSLSTGAYQIKYNGEFNQIINNNDLVFRSSFYNPVLNNFFGFGNNSPRDESRPEDYYRVRFKYVSFETLLRRRHFDNLLHFYLGPTFFHYWNNQTDNENKILSNPSLIGLDSLSIYGQKSYVGGKFAVEINNLNSELLPSRGVIWNTELTSEFGVNKNSNDITKITSDMTVYASLRDPAKLIAVLRLGAGHIFNKDFEYFQALTLGANNYLRGFRKNRFSGQSRVYQSVELRVKLFESKSYVLPGAVGLIAFNEIGKIWMKDIKSKKWHHDFGGGLYYSPYNFALVSATIAFSPEDYLFNFSIGTKFNINF